MANNIGANGRDQDSQYAPLNSEIDDQDTDAPNLESPNQPATSTTTFFIYL